MRIGIVGAGILGLAVARQMARAGAEVTVLEKEPRIAAHQTGHNSGVVHAGIYYQPGSLKATLCREGAAMLREYCAEHGLPYDEAGKLVVASTRAELPGLRRIAERARENGVPGIAELDAIGLREVEPHASGSPPSTRRTPRSPTSPRSRAASPPTWPRPAGPYGSRVPYARSGRPPTAWRWRPGRRGSPSTG